MRFAVSEWIGAPPEKVFAQIADLDGMVEWAPNLVRIERLTEGGFRQGARWREVRRMYGREASEEFELRAMVPPAAFTVVVDGRKGSSKRGEYRFDHRLVSENGGTRLQIDGEITGMGWMGAILGPLMKGAFKKAIRRDVLSLKAHIEGLSP